MRKERRPVTTYEEIEVYTFDEVKQALKSFLHALLQKSISGVGISSLESRDLLCHIDNMLKDVDVLNLSKTLKLVSKNAELAPAMSNWK